MPEDRREVIEITQDTYAELAETDNMYLNLPLGASVSGISVDQRLGDAYIDVCIDVPDDNMNEFKEWLGERGNQYTEKQNHIYISYFVSDSRAQFGERADSSSATLFTKIYWTVLVCVIIILFIPFEKICKRNTRVYEEKIDKI